MSRRSPRMSDDEVRTATVADLEMTAAVLADAFFDDPVFRWLFPDDLDRPRLAQGMFTVLGRHLYLPQGESLVGPECAAYWESPEPPAEDDFWAAHGEEFVAAVEGQVERIMAMGATTAVHHPTEPCFYLSLLGVRPSAAGRGLGGRLLAHKLEQLDAVGGAAYLEATSTRSRALYERHGFVLLEEFAPEGGPTMYGMWREPR
jgi:ribosomal protein S18 acetylase RimI-like enzyme